MKSVGLRYEEHSNANTHLPFVFSPSITITKSTMNPDANWHDSLEIQYCIDGTGYVTVDAEKTEFSPGETMVINTNVIHRTTTDGHIEYACLIIDRDFCDEADIPTASLRFEQKFTSSVMEEYFKELTMAYNDRSDVCRTAKLQALVLEMLIEIRTSHLSQDTLTGQVNNAVFERTKRAIKYIRNNFSSRLTLDGIAKEVMVNKYAMSREFKRMTGQTVVEYINLYRCKVARDMIISGATVAEAASLCGFDNLSFFTRTFKRYIGVLPSKFKYMANI